MRDMRKAIPALIFLAAMSTAAWSPRPGGVDTPCCTIERFIWRESMVTTSGPDGDCILHHGEDAWWINTKSDSWAWLDEGDAFGSIYVSQQGTEALEVIDPCDGWLYQWAAIGKISGLVKSKATSAMLASAKAGGSAAAHLEEDLDAFSSEKVAASSDGSVTVFIGIGTSGPSGGIVWSPGSISGEDEESNRHLQDNDTKGGPGYVVQVGIDERAEATATAISPTEGAVYPHTRKSFAYGAAYPDIWLLLAIYCANPASGQATVTTYATTAPSPSPPGGATTPPSVGGTTQTGTYAHDDTEITWEPAEPAPPPEVLGFKPPPKPEFEDPDGDGWYEHDG